MENGSGPESLPPGLEGLIREAIKNMPRGVDASATEPSSDASRTSTGGQKQPPTTDRDRESNKSTSEPTQSPIGTKQIEDYLKHLSDRQGLQLDDWIRDVEKTTGRPIARDDLPPNRATNDDSFVRDLIKRVERSPAFRGQRRGSNRRRPGGGNRSPDRRTASEPRDFDRSNDNDSTRRLPDKNTGSLNDKWRNVWRNATERTLNPEAARRTASENPKSSGAATDGRSKSILSNALEKATKAIAKEAQDFAERPGRGGLRGTIGRLESIHNRANEWFDGLSGSTGVTGEAPSIPELPDGSLSMPETKSNVLLIAGAIVAIGIAVAFWAGRPGDTAELPPIPRADKLHTAHDIVQAFHALCARSSRVTAHWWPHTRAAEAMAGELPHREAAMERLARVYEHARYRPPNEVLPKDELDAARRAIKAFGGA